MCDDKVAIIDGGFSTQLCKHVKGESIDGDPLWTGKFLSTDPEAVFQTHLDYLRAGADIIETNTYQASVTGYKRYLGLNEEESLELIRLAVNLAKRAVELHRQELTGENKKKQWLVAGSVGPYGAALHDGSEYTGSYGLTVSKEAMVEWHRPRIQTLVDAGVDLLALETIPCSREAEALIELLGSEFPSTKAWMTFSCQGDGVSLADGTNFAQEALRCYQQALPGQLVAVGVNCLAPRLVTPLLRSLQEYHQRIPLIAYPNSGEKYTVADGWQIDGDFRPPEEFVQEWLDIGVRYIGGCCRTDNRDIRRILTEVQRWQKRKSGSGINSIRNGH